MFIEEAHLFSFRNLENSEISFCPGVNLIYGENGAGKTNFIESLWLGTGLKSFRGAKSSQLVAFDHPYARVLLKFDMGGRKQVIDMVFPKGESQRRQKLNGILQSRVSVLSGIFFCVVFSPDHMNLVSGPPALRRRFLDMAISQLYPHYPDLIQKYQKSLLQRNHLLRKIKDHPSLLSTLPIWDESLVGFGASIMEYRQRHISALLKSAKHYYEGISGGRESLSLSYQSSVPFAESTFDIKAVGDIYREKLSEGLKEDQKTGFTSIGVHRDDLRFSLSGKSVRIYGSQGQKRSCVLSLKLAESDVIAKAMGEEPVIFLDDVLSELDERRQHYILSHLRGKQVFITGCERPADPSLPRGRVFHMTKGHLTVEL